MAHEEPGHAKWRAGYVLLIAGLVSVVSYYDRFLLTILVEPVKHDLGISDGQVGLLAGIGFALVYGVLGIPMARIADRYGRARILAGFLALWSAMTALSGATSNFTTMLLARVGVGVGEAGGIPTVHALVADRFSPGRRGLALSTIGAWGALGMSLALAAGGFISDHWGWRMAFYLSGIPGIVLALLVRFSVADPRSTGSAVAPSSVPPIAASFRLLWERRSFFLVCVGVGLAGISQYGMQVWSPAFLMRTYGMSAGEVGVSYSVAVGPASVVSILLGGWINDRLVQRDVRWSAWLLAWSFGLSVPLVLAFLLVRSYAVAMVLTVLWTLVGNLWTGPAYAAVQNLAGPQLRALAAAIFMMIINLFGVALGPVIPGVLSDVLAPHFGASSLMIGLCILAAGGAVPLVLFLMAARTIKADVLDANR